MGEKDSVMWAAFKAFDTDNSGFISREDLKKVLDRADVQDVWSEKVCSDVSNDIIKELDSNGDGKVSFEDWKALMSSCWEADAVPTGDEENRLLLRSNHVDGAGILNLRPYD